MNECVIPSAPNWFLSSVSSGNDAGLYAFGAKNNVFVYDTSHIPCETAWPDFVDDERPQGLSHKVPKFVSLFTQHELKIVAVCLSPDPGQLICCSADEMVVKLWDIRSRTLIQTHSEHKDKITCMTWFPCDSNLILTGSEKGNMILWKLKSNDTATFQPQRDHIICVKASPHSAGLVAIGYRNSGIVIVNILNSQLCIMQKLRGFEAEVTSICWCPVEGQCDLELAAGHPGTLIAAGGGKLIKIWDSISGKEVFFKRLQSGTASKYNSLDPASKKFWLDIHWQKSNPDMLVSSSTSSHGELLLWNLRTKKQQEPDLFDSSNINKHLRVIFNITSVGDKLCTFSLDRVIALWDMKSRRGIVSWCALGGFSYCIRASLVDPGLLAIGSGDNTIRIWNLNNKIKPFDVSSLCYGARSFITSVAWHPEREGLLAFGTDDGRVGIVNTLSVKPPTMSSTYHKRTVYVVCWGPPLNYEKGASHHYQVYSLGDGTVLQHFIGEPGNQSEAVNLLKAIEDVNGPDLIPMVRSDIIWKWDYTAVVIGFDNGLVKVFNFPGLKLVFSINIHLKMVNCLKWHPQFTAESIHGSPCRNWLAFGGNDRPISVVDLPNLFAEAEVSSFSTVTISEAFCQLPGHLTKTTDMCWSPHHDGRLVSVGYDRVAIVWNVKNGEGLASYNGHNDRMMTVSWSYLDPDLIITGGCDATIRVWRISAQSRSLVDLKDRVKKKKYYPVQPETSYAEYMYKQGEQTASEQEMKELEGLLLAKQQQIMSQMDPQAAESSATDVSSDHFVENGRDSTNSQHQLSSSKDNFGNTRTSRPLDYGTTTTPFSQDNAVPSDPASSNGRDVVATTSQSPLSLDSHSSSTAASRVGISSQFPADRGATTRQSPTSLGSHSAPTDASRVDSGNGGISSQFPAGHADRLPTQSQSGPSSTLSPLAGEGDNSDIGDEYTTAAEDLNSIPSVTDLVPPVKILFPTKPASSTGGGPQKTPATASFTTGPQDKNKKRKTKLRSYFPVASNAINKGKSSQQEDILELSRIIAGQDGASILDKKPHLGIFADRLGAHRFLLQESEHHLSYDNMEYHLQLELWRGNIAGAIQIARQRNELSDWIVSMAPLASHDLWQLVCSEYAEQLEEDGQYHKAATYLLAAHQVHGAVEMFRRHHLFKEAVLLARIRLSPIDPILEDLYTEWSQNLLKEGQYEQAAQCYLSMRNVQEAAKSVARRFDQSSLRTACHMTLLANEKQHGLQLGYKVFSQYLVAGEWQEALTFISEHEDLKILAPVLYVHELLIEHLATLCPGMNFIQKPVTSDAFTQWETLGTKKKRTELPEFLLDKSNIDPVVPWEQILIGGHTFPHQVLQGWYHYLDMSMVTQQLRAMHDEISHLSSYRHTMVDNNIMLFRVSVDITLCLLALLISETSTAIIHLVQALSSIHNSTQASVQQALCRLMLPQGPKYLLKLQREFNASHVLITMDNQGDIDNTSREIHNTNSIKKFLTDLKDDGAISMSSLRCRELDCLRAYCYLAILDYHDKFLHSQSENDSIDGIPNRDLTPAQNIQNNDQKNDVSTNEKDDNRLEHIEQKNVKIESAFLNGDTDKVVVKQLDSDMDQNGKVCYNGKLTDNGKHNHNGKSHHKCKLSQNGMLTSNGDSSSLSSFSVDHLVDNGDAFCSVANSSSADCDQQTSYNNSSDVSSKNSCDRQLSHAAVATPSSATSLLAASAISIYSATPSSATSLLAASAISTYSVKSPSSATSLWASSAASAISPSATPSETSSPTSTVSSATPSEIPSSSSQTSQPLLPESSSELPPSVNYIVPSSTKIPSNPPSIGNIHTQINSDLAQLHQPPSSPLKTTTKLSTAASKSTQEVSPKCPALSVHSLPSDQPDIVGDLNYRNLHRLSKGILWDVQAKREALTETLGYIHQAISRLLLFNRSSNNNSQLESSLENSCHTSICSENLYPTSNFENLCSASKKSATQQTATTITNSEEDGSCNRTRLSSPHSPSHELETSLQSPTCPETSSYIPAVNLTPTNICSTSKNVTTTTTEQFSTNLDHARPSSPQLTAQTTTPNLNSSLNSLSDNEKPISVHVDSPGSPFKQGQPSKSPIETAHITSGPVSFQKSRKVLWIDGRDSENVDLINGDPSSQLSRLAPDGSPIPLDWDGLPVDVKYTLPYVTLALLREEQTNISEELKRVPDVSRIPFPAAAASVRKLLQTSLRSQHLTQPEKISYMKQLKDWATVFSVTSHQQTEMEALFESVTVE